MRGELKLIRGTRCLLGALLNRHVLRAGEVVLLVEAVTGERLDLERLAREIHAVHGERDLLRQRGIGTGRFNVVQAQVDNGNVDGAVLVGRCHDGMLGYAVGERSFVRKRRAHHLGAKAAIQHLEDVRARRGEELELAGSVLLVVQVVLGNGLDNGLLGGAKRVGTAGIVFSPVE